MLSFFQVADQQRRAKANNEINKSGKQDHLNLRTITLTNG